jgi:hypothetical protein
VKTGVAPAPEPAPAPATYSALFSVMEKGVEAEVAGAELRLDGKSIGRTPNVERAGLVVGKTYKLQASAKGYEPARTEFTHDAPTEKRVVLELAKRQPAPAPKRVAAAGAREAPAAKKAMGRLAATSDPLGAEIYIDGQKTPYKTPISKANAIPVPVGTHEVTFRFEGRKSAPVAVEIKEGDDPAIAKGKID